MKWTALLLPLAVSASVMKLGNFMNVDASMVEVDKLEPRYRKTANRHRYKIGPYTLDASTGGLFDSTFGGQAIFMGMPPGTLCNRGDACTILAGKVGVMYADGTEALPKNGIYIHHILSSDTTKVQSPWLSNCGIPFLPALNIAAITGGTAFVGTGEDSADGLALYTSEDGTRESGYHVGARDNFNGWAQLVNYNKEAKKIYVYFDLEWVPGIYGDDVKTATFTATCGTTPWVSLSAAGETNTTSGKFYFMENGKILGARGHLHDGGVRMVMKINDKYVCQSDAIYGQRSEEESGMGGHAHKPSGSMAKPETSVKTISSMTTCNGPFTVKKGDTLSLTGVYDLSKHPLRESATGAKAADVMAMMGISFSADKKAGL